MRGAVRGRWGRARLVARLRCSYFVRFSDESLNENLRAGLDFFESITNEQIDTWTITNRTAYWWAMGSSMVYMSLHVHAHYMSTASKRIHTVLFRCSRPCETCTSDGHTLGGAHPCASDPPRGRARRTQLAWVEARQL